MRQRDVEPDGRRADIGGAPVGGLHDARATSGDRQQTVVFGTVSGASDDASEVPGDLVVATLLELALGVDESGFELVVAGALRHRPPGRVAPAG